MKFTILLSLAIILLSVHAQDETKPVKDKGAVQKIIEETLAKIQKLFDSGCEKVQEVVSKIFEMIDNAMELVEENIEKAKKAINDMANTGEKYMKCVEQQKETLNEIENNAKAGIAECKKIATDKSKEVIQDVTNEFPKIQKQVGAAIDKCFEEHPFTSLLCATKEAFTIYVQAGTNVPKLIIDSKNKISEISKETNLCIQDVEVKSKSAYDNIIKVIKACADAA